MVSFTYNDSGKRTITNNIIILTKRGADTTYTVILAKYYKYPSTTIIKHANVMATVNKLPCRRLLNITPGDA